MTNSTTTEAIKFLIPLSYPQLICLIVFILFGVLLLLAGIIEVLGYDLLGVAGIIVGLCMFLASAVVIINCTIPFNLTEKTQIQQEKVQIIQTEGKLLSSDGLTLFLKNSHGKYFKKKISVDGDDDVKFKEEGNSYIYTQVKTKVTYDTKHKIRAIFSFSELPSDKSTTQIILTVPKGTLTQNK